MAQQLSLSEKRRLLALVAAYTPRHGRKTRQSARGASGKPLRGVKKLSLCQRNFGSICKVGMRGAINKKKGGKKTYLMGRAQI